MLTATRRVALAAMLMSIPIAATAAPLMVESRPTLQLSTPSVATPIELGESAGGSFRYDGRPDVDLGGSDEAGPSLQTRMFETQALLRCKVEDGDLMIANVGTDAIDAGTTIRWQVKGSGQRGYFNLGQPLGAGSSLRARDALGETGGGDGRCSARAV
jgi:hypothetical protein